MMAISSILQLFLHGVCGGNSQFYIMQNCCDKTKKMIV